MNAKAIAEKLSTLKKRKVQYEEQLPAAQEAAQEASADPEAFRAAHTDLAGLRAALEATDSAIREAEAAHEEANAAEERRRMTEELKQRAEAAVKAKKAFTKRRAAFAELLAEEAESLGAAHAAWKAEHEAFKRRFLDLAPGMSTYQITRSDDAERMTAERDELAALFDRSEIEAAMPRRFVDSTDYKPAQHHGCREDLTDAEAWAEHILKNY